MFSNPSPSIPWSSKHNLFKVFLVILNVFYKCRRLSNPLARIHGAKKPYLFKMFLVVFNLCTCFLCLPILPQASCGLINIICS